MLPKLFQISNAATRKPVPGLLFETKLAAKFKRHEMNDKAGVFAYYVSPGPDHRKYKEKNK